MTEQEFRTGMDRLANSYPKGAYPPERVTSIGKMVSRESADWWGRAVTTLIDTCRQAPLRAEINDLLLQERERNWSRQKRQPMTYSAPKGSCSYCGGIGTVLCRCTAHGADEGTYVYAFRCECEAGDQQPWNYPAFDAQAVSAGFYRLGTLR